MVVSKSRLLTPIGEMFKLTCPKLKKTTKLYHTLPTPQKKNSNNCFSVFLSTRQVSGCGQRTNSALTGRSLFLHQRAFTAGFQWAS